MATPFRCVGPVHRTVFDDLVAAQVEEAAKAGGCGLLNVELDRRPGEEAPRVTIRSIQSFESLQAHPPPAPGGVEGPDCSASRTAVGRPRRRQGHSLSTKLEAGGADIISARFLLDAELAAESNGWRRRLRVASPSPNRPALLWSPRHR
jgi:DNA polymerase-3 subunit alpha